MIFIISSRKVSVCATKTTWISIMWARIYRFVSALIILFKGPWITIFKMTSTKVAATITVCTALATLSNAFVSLPVEDSCRGIRFFMMVCGQICFFRSSINSR